MTAIPVVYSNLDHLHRDDTMDLASSPHIQLEDFDLEVDPMRDPSVEPAQDTMIEDDAENQQPSTDPMQADHEDIFQDDDDMQDEDITIRNTEAVFEEPDVAAPLIANEPTADDDEALYEEEQQTNSKIEGSTEAQDVEFVEGDDVVGREPIISDFVGGDAENEYHHDDQERFEEEISYGHSENANSGLKARRITPGEADLKDSANTLTEKTIEAGSLERNSLEEGLKDPVTQLEGQKLSDVIGRPRHTEESATITVKASCGHTANRSLSTASNTKDSLSLHGAQDARNGQDFTERSNGLDDTSSNKPGKHDSAADDVRASAQSAALYAVRVHYDGSEICLFPPSEDDSSETFFLPDVGLANESLENLLRECRQVLAGSIGEHDELVLDVASLGLHISEGSSYARQITFSQIIEVYVALCLNEDIELFEPLYCTLTSRISLASQHAYLISAALEGRTFADIEAEHIGSNDRSDGPAPVPDAGATEKHESMVEEAIVETDAFHHITERESNTAKDQSPNAYQGFSIATISAPPADQNTTVVDRVGSYEERDPAVSIEKLVSFDCEEDRGEERSNTSIVRGDGLDHEGDYVTSVNICNGPGMCLCSCCFANVDADTQSATNCEPEIRTSDHRIGQGNRHYHARDTNEILRDNDLHADTDSSKTIESDGGEQATHFAGQPEDGHIPDEIAYDDPGDDSLLEDEVQTDGIGEQHTLHSSFENLSQVRSDLTKRRGIAQSALSTEAPQIHTDGSEHAASGSQGVEKDDLLDFDDGDLLGEETINIPSQVVNHGGNGTLEVPEDLFEDLEVADEHQQNTSNAVNLKEQSSDQEDPISGTQAEAIPSSIDGTPPMTPPHNKYSKRTREDEDEYGLLNASTPDPKRRRPS